MSDGLPKPSDRDFDLLRSGSRASLSSWFLKGTFGILGLLVLALLISYFIRLRTGDELSVAASRERTLALRHTWSDSFVERWDRYRVWFHRHGIRSESVLFDDLSAMIVENMVTSNSAQAGEDELSGFGRIYLSLHQGVVRLLFLLIASVRLSLSAFLVAGLSGIFAYKPYRREDALGQMGNGRVYYSGVRAGLDTLTSEGAPDVQVRGFACPQFCTSAEARASEIWRVLEEFGATNQTNEALTRILVKNGDTAPYVAAVDEEASLQGAFESGSLLENTPHILRAALAQHAEYAAGQFRDARMEERIEPPSRAISSEEYGALVQRAFDVVLTRRNKATIAELPSAEIATLVLAFESGKILAHAFEGGKWTRRSNFPHLSARAVLHSVVEYPKDYDFYSRTRLRRGLIYAARKSAFSPVRMPVDMSDDSWVLRQWAEVMLACPHEISSVTDEVELVGLVREAHGHWCQAFFDSRGNTLKTFSERGFATATNLLVLPVADIVGTMREFVPRETILRMHVLLQRVATVQQRQREAESESGPTLQLSFERVEKLPPESELRRLAEIHQLGFPEVQDWLALRNILSAYGWIASRVGDYSVPHTSLIFAVFKCSVPLAGVNALGLLGRPGMVPLRGSKLAEVWGSSWSSRFTFVNKATMAESLEDYGKLLQGVEDIKPVDEEAPIGVSKAQV